MTPIRGRARLAALASPVRQEIVDALETGGACTMAELAARMGRPADALYFHVRKLVGVGLLVEAGRVRAGPTASAALYDVCARPLRIDRSAASARSMDAIVTGVLRLAARDYRRALTHASAVAAGAGRNHWAGRVRGWLSPRDLARLNGLLEEIHALMRTGGPGEERAPISVVVAMSPLPVRSRGGGGSARGSAPKATQGPRASRKKG